MSEKPKQNEPAKTKVEKPVPERSPNDRNPDIAPKSKRSYYYDDAYGYEDFEPQNDDPAKEEETPK